MVKRYYRGTTEEEAMALGEGYQHRAVTHWTDSLEGAAMYSKGAVISMEFDEMPRWWNRKMSIAEGDSVHGNIREWKISIDEFEKDGGMYCHCEESKVLLEGHDY